MPGHGVITPGKAPARQPRWTWPTIHHVLFLAFTLTACVPIAVFAMWEARSAYQNEVDTARDRHLQVARNLTSTLSRYVNDLRSTAPMVFPPGAFPVPPGQGLFEQPAQALRELLTSLNVTYIAVLNANGSVESALSGLPDSEHELNLDQDRFNALRTLAAEARDQIAISGLYHDDLGRPILYLAKTLPDGRLGLGIVSTRYLITLQQSVAFGENGHAAITDGKGQVIAHPLKDWVASSRDVSGSPLVAAMMRGETGVGQFWSPSTNGTLIAGYAVVPETGWGVMVAQPIVELRNHADEIIHLAMITALGTFMSAAFISYLIATWLTRPIRRIAATAEAVTSGNDQVEVRNFGSWAPSEVQGLGFAVNTMLSELRRRAAETSEALNQAESSNRAKTQFMANMSHELRTPLNGVVGMVELLRLSGASTTQQNYIEQASRSAQALLRMVSDVLDLSEMEVGKIELKPAPFRLDTLIASLRDQYIRPAQSKGLNLAVSLPEALHITLIGDGQRVSQMLGNLLDNAIRFTDSGGVAARVSASEETANTIRIRFEVGDTGIGIPADVQKRIFDAFAQGDGSTASRNGGSGLGLAIVKELSQRMNGEFGVQSIVGVGSTFWLSIPFEKATADQARKPVPRPAPVLPRTPPPPAPIGFRPRMVTAAGQEFQEMLRHAGRTSVRILLVEDNPANLRVTKALLETLGCEVRTATNGVQAVAAYRDGIYDLVLMDCQMPEMDGYQATAAIRHVETLLGRFTPIVALTAHALDGSREECMAAGMNDQLPKPLTLAALTGKLLEWLAAARPAA